MSRRAAAMILLVMVAAVGGLLLLNRPTASNRTFRRRLSFLRVTPAPVSGTPRPGAPAEPGAFLRTLFEELARGPTRPGLIRVLPPRIQLRNGFLMPSGEVVLDLAVDSGLSFGSADELSLVSTLVDTMLQNVANTQRVRILVNGEPAESLGGHVDLTRPMGFLRDDLAP